MNTLRTHITTIGLTAVSLLLLGAVALPAAAQSTDGEESVVEESTPVEIIANAGEDRNVVAGRKVLFDGSGSRVSDGAEATYTWDFGDGQTADGVDATHVFEESGAFPVRLTVETVVDGDVLSSTDQVVVSVQERLVLLITDQSVSEEEVQDLRQYGLTQGTLIVHIRDSGVDQEYQSIQNLAQAVYKRDEDIAAADMVVTWTTGNVGLSSLVELSRVAQANDQSLDSFNLDTKAIVAVSNNQTLTTNAKFASGVFQSIQPRLIVAADKNILDDAVRAEGPEEFERQLYTADAEYQIITQYTTRGLDDLSPLNFMSYAVNFMINSGVPVNSVFLILMLPIMATIIAVARQVGGVKAFGIFAPTVVALSFLATGLQIGVSIFIAIIVLGTLARLAARKLRLLYLPRMAIVLSLLALAIFVMFLLASYLNLTGFIGIAIFPILIMAVLTEQFVSVQIEQGYKTAIKLTVETLLLSIVGYLIGDWTFFKTIILAYPELILLTFVINYAAGKFSGLRLAEYIRFRKVFKHISNAEKQ